MRSTTLLIALALLWLATPSCKDPQPAGDDDDITDDDDDDDTTTGVNYIPPDRRIDWDPGVRGGVPDEAEVCPATAAAVTDYGAIGDGVTDDAAAFAAAIAAASGGQVILVPQGDYLLRSGLSIDKGIVLCGQGPTLSRLLFDTEDIGIDVVIYDRGEWTPISSGHTKDSTALVVADPSEFEVGKYAEIQQDNDWSLMDPDGIWQYESWVPDSAVGQMLHIVAIDGDTITVEPPLTMDYDAAMNPELRAMGLVDGFGLQGLYVERLDDSAWAATIQFKNTANAWIRDCEGGWTFESHAEVSTSLWCEIRDSTFHDAHVHGDGGQGYGTNLSTHTTACLVENNIYSMLRHSMLIQVGATGNVFGYNYSRDNFTEEDWTPCDISMHGHYTNMNLFESNVIQEVDIADFWGPCGPGNTLLRNRTESEGIEIDDHSHRQTIVGNELTEGDNLITVHDGVDYTLIHGNLLGGNVVWDPLIGEHEIPVSLYLDERPDWFGDNPWPALGADIAADGHTIPAQLRDEQRTDR